ncbi:MULTISPECIES: hypothetical protein [Fusobacterium]|uniref:hypothetical protein n=1 Tax=Fusobacterium TaxID=848 RepID=UPI00241C08E2|nr:MULTISPECIES: hypothetical protein [Fusobacterium]
MRKVKNAKKNNTIKLITDLEYARAVEAAKGIAETHAEYKVLNYLACTQQIFDEEVAEILVAITSYLYTNDRAKKFKMKIAIRNNIRSLVTLAAPYLLANTNTQIFTVLFELNEILVDYSSLENKMLREIEKKGFQETYPEFKKAMQEADGNFLKERINVILGYEPVFNEEIKEKFLDVLNWLPKTITRLIKYNSQFYVPSVLSEEINRKLEIILQVANKKLGYTDQAEKLFKNECTLINELATRVMLVQGAFPILEEENRKLFPTEYKKDLTHLKGTLTRVKNLLGILYDYLNYGEIKKGELNV